MLIDSLGFPYIPFKTDTIHKGVCDEEVILKILVEKSEVRRPLGISRLRYENNIKMGVKYCGTVRGGFIWHMAGTSCGQLSAL